jgi:hypothetical protein
MFRQSAKNPPDGVGNIYHGWFEAAQFTTWNAHGISGSFPNIRSQTSPIRLTPLLSVSEVDPKVTLTEIG